MDERLRGFIRELSLGLVALERINGELSEKASSGFLHALAVASNLARERGVPVVIVSGDIVRGVVIIAIPGREPRVHYCAIELGMTSVCDDKKVIDSWPSGEDKASVKIYLVPRGVAARYGILS